MKKIIYLITLLLIISSCSVTLEESKVDNPLKVTTAEVLNNIDTCVVSIVDGNLYLMNDGLVEYQAVMVDNDVILIKVWLVLILGLVLMIMLIVLFIFINTLE